MQHEDVQARQEAVRLAIDILRGKDGTLHCNPEEVIGIADKVSRFIMNTKEVK